jgi:hypothetical protein
MASQINTLSRDLEFAKLIIPSTLQSRTPGI